MLDHATTSLGSTLRQFRDDVCPHFAPPQEIVLAQSAKSRKNRNETTNQAPKRKQQTRKKPGEVSDTFSLNTFKVHSLGDYVDCIRRHGTTDSYSTQPVWKIVHDSARSNARTPGRSRTQDLQIDVSKNSNAKGYIYKGNDKVGQFGWSYAAD